MHVPREIVTVTFNDIDLDDPGKLDAMEFAAEFVENINRANAKRPLSLWRFWRGKTFLLGAIANQLADKGVSTMIVFYPELLRELKGSIGDSTLNEKIEMIKKQPVLMIDDIGAETMSSWTRDEVLSRFCNSACRSTSRHFSRLISVMMNWSTT